LSIFSELIRKSTFENEWIIDKRKPRFERFLIVFMELMQRRA